MAVVIVVEDGTGIELANSYMDLAYARNLAETFGANLPADDDAASTNLINGAFFLNTYEPRMQGARSKPTNPLAFPRVRVEGLAEDTIPQNVKIAQVMAAGYITDGTILLPVVSGQRVTKEKVGPIETEYSDEYTATFDEMPMYTALESYLFQYFYSLGGYKLTRRIGF